MTAWLPTTRFNCPNCGAPYKVVRVEADPLTADHEITCLSCDAPLRGREGGLVLKYFLVGR
jgi:predicted nucleic acid-binding Zn ribbon protein